MPSPNDVAELRGANAELSRRVVADLTGFWNTLDLTKPEAARDALMYFVPELTTRYGEAAALVAADWYDAVRAADGVEARYAAEQADTFAKEWVEQRTRYGARHLFSDTPEKMLRFMDGVVQQYALQPGRDTIAHAAVTDPAANGWKRDARGDSCSFCRMLEGRGAVYKSSTVRFVAHGDCHCVPVPDWNKGAMVETAKPVQVPAKTPVGAAEGADGTEEVPESERAVVANLTNALKDGKFTPAQLHVAAVESGNPLAVANANAAIRRHAAVLGDTLKFPTAQAGRDWANRAWPGPEGYTQEQLKALRDYTGSGYGPMNNTLRSSRGKRTNKDIRAMDAAIERAPRVPNNITVVRNANLRQLGITGGRQDPRSAIGQELVDHGYLSTSVNRRGSMGGEVRLEIAVPKGSKAVYVSGAGGPKSPSIISDYGGGESELIMARGSKLRIISVKKVGKRLHVTADLIQEG